MKNTRSRTLIINPPPGGVNGFITKLKEEFKGLTSELEKWKTYRNSDPFVRLAISDLSFKAEVYQVLIQHYQNEEVKNES